MSNIIVMSESSSPSPPSVSGVFFATEWVDVDFMQVGTTVLYTPPSDFVFLGNIVYMTDITDRVDNPTASVGTNSTAYDNFFPQFIPPSDEEGFSQNSYSDEGIFSGIVPVPSGTPIVLSVTIPPNATTYSGKMAVYGYFLP